MFVRYFRLGQFAIKGNNVLLKMSAGITSSRGLPHSLLARSRHIFLSHQRAPINLLSNNSLNKHASLSGGRGFTTKSRPYLLSSAGLDFRFSGTSFLVGLAGLGVLLYFTEDNTRRFVDNAALISSRVSIVVVTTTKCVYHYTRVLGAQYASEQDRELALKDCHKRCAKITMEAIVRNGGIYIKLGQHLSAMTYLFPPEWTQTMEPLQDRCPVSSIESINKMFLTDTGKDIKATFSEFDYVPLGSASLGQVHRAVLKDSGEAVAVKVQHPTLADFVPVDVFMTKWVFNAIDLFFPQYPLTWLSDELQSSIYVELDFTQEAHNAEKTAKYFEHTTSYTALRVPKIIMAKPRILIMEFLPGSRIDDLEYLDRHNISRSEVSSCLSHIFNNMIFTPDVGVHCDPHGGNLSIRAIANPHRGQHNFEIILYDHGLYRDIPTKLRYDYAHFWLALIDNDQEAMRYYAKQFAGVTDEQYPLLSAAITGRDFKNVTNVKTPRTADEIENMSSTVSSPTFLSDLMILLHQMPRIVLLIIKTNDLTRHLDECLQSSLGFMRTFMIMATYCARTVYEEQQNMLSNDDFKGHAWKKLWLEWAAWWSYRKRLLQLGFYDFTLTVKNLVGF
ncbi:ABC1-domain-containing protein [Nadsonia fulvescens var. elongata DSM 6958]|uniref:ABC1-domain-containing protein n=1 Tax=Nadsonia fulvescens var. elongata DSM 6958 TaxID=857566 RepID=A0A1E3PR50_9ASCO|nr:ABC1-domain-containing protein [Nadsonia fulvescens var. elongata DSM 6958]